MFESQCGTERPHWRQVSAERLHIKCLDTDAQTKHTQCTHRYQKTPLEHAGHSNVTSLCAALVHRIICAPVNWVLFHSRSPDPCERDSAEQLYLVPFTAAVSGTFTSLLQLPAEYHPPLFKNKSCLS